MTIDMAWRQDVSGIASWLNSLQESRFKKNGATPPDTVDAELYPEQEQWSQTEEEISLLMPPIMRTKPDGSFFEKVIQDAPWFCWRLHVCLQVNGMLHPRRTGKLSVADTFLPADQWNVASLENKITTSCVYLLHRVSITLVQYMLACPIPWGIMSRRPQYWSKYLG